MSNHVLTVLHGKNVESAILWLSFRLKMPIAKVMDANKKPNEAAQTTKNNSLGQKLQWLLASIITVFSIAFASYHYLWEGQQALPEFLSFSSLQAKNNLNSLDYEIDLLEKKWKADLKQMAQNQQLPPEFQQIKSLQVYPNSYKAALWLDHIKPPIQYNSKGNIKLEISIDSYETKDELLAIINYHFIDLASGNSIKEFGRNHYLRFKKNAKSKKIKSKQKTKNT